MILVLGGGPAGIMAALAAAQAGGRVILLEKNPQLGRKLLLTGSGRCNLTHEADPPGLVENMPGNGRFLYGAFSRFGPSALRIFFADLGLATKVEADGRVFPAADRAQDVLQTLEQALADRGVTCRTGLRAEGLAVAEGHLTGVQTDKGFLPARAAIVATGGVSYPATGATGDGYRLAAAVGHRVIPPRPSLVPLETAETWVPALRGLSLPLVRLTMHAGGGALATSVGELLFTHFGVSGPAVLRLSRAAVPILARGERLRLSLDLFPGLEPGEMSSLIREELDQHGRRLGRNILAAHLPARFREVILARCGVPPDKPAHQFSRTDRENLARILKDLPLTLTGARPLAEAIVTAGGVAVGEISPRTMASRLVHGLYFAGEVMDVDGNTGGFNLQTAFSTGYLAGDSAALGRE